MIELLEPLAGSMAVSIFVLGLVAAGVSSQFPNVLMLPWLLCDYTGTERNMTLGRYRVMVLLISLLGRVVPIKVYANRPSDCEAVVSVICDALDQERELHGMVVAPHR